MAIGGIANPLDHEMLQRISLHQPISLTRDDVDFYRYLGMYVDVETGRNSTPKWIGKGSFGEFQAKLHLIDSLFPGTKGDVLKLGMISNDPDKNSQLMQTLLASMTSDWCQKVLRKSSQQKEEQAKRVSTLIDNAQRSDTFPAALKAIDHSIANVKMFVFETGSGEDLLIALKQAFPDKALYIDCWATWCGPCIVEFPFSKTLHERSKDLPVEFVYLCIDDKSTVDKWKGMIAKHELKGTHIYVKYSIMSAFMGMFSLSGYPSYILFNSKGKYVQDFNRKPSSLSPELLRQFLQ
ncbi:MAG: TlpA disulfide reductase family protein [Chitinophagaceae bacterium]